MSSEIYVWDRGLDMLIPKSQWLANKHNRQMPRYVESPTLISDSMDAVKSMLDGRMYDSKSRLRQTYKDHDMTEVGDDSSIMDPKPFVPPPIDKAAIDKAVEQAWSQVDLVNPG